MLNQKPQRITATLLLAFFKPAAHALLTAYPRQFPKLLRHTKEVTVVKIHELIDNADAPEEKAALTNLETWLDDTLKQLNAGRGLTPPAEIEMPVFKEPDNTDDARDDSW